MHAWFRSFALLLGLAALAAGCELMVQLDRSEADAGADVGCTICTDVAVFGDTGADAEATDAEITDSGPSPVTDSGVARSDGQVSDAGGTGGKDGG